jgi:hypothetical protein
MTVALDLPALTAEAVPTPATAPLRPVDPHPWARPVLRVVPAPDCAPPFDDDPAPAPLPLLRPVAPAQVSPGWDDSAWFSEDRTPSAQLPPVEPLARLLVQGLVEVLSGARPLRLFRMHLEVELYAAFETRLEGGRRRSGPRPQQVLRSLHAQVRPEGVAEVCATVRRGDRCAAVALRLEGFCGRWLCTEVEGL